MAKTKGDYKIPFSCTGDLLHHPENWCNNWQMHDDDSIDRRHEPIWRDNETFVATLTLASMSRGRSAAYFDWLDRDGHSYPMFMKDLTELLKNSVVSHGQVGPCTWKFVKRGQNYGIALAG